VLEIDVDGELCGKAEKGNALDFFSDFLSSSLPGHNHTFHKPKCIYTTDALKGQFDFFSYEIENASMMRNCKEPLRMTLRRVIRHF
jgi:hypothetical protein